MNLLHAHAALGYVEHVDSLPPPICKNCKQEIRRDVNGQWLYVEKRGRGHFAIEYLVYICYSVGDELHGHEPMDRLEQFGVYDLYDIERSLR